MNAELEALEARLRPALLASVDERGAFVGELSSSALSTATAAMACELASRARKERGEEHAPLQGLAREGRAWLVRHQNADGGYGDTVESPSNISTSTLAWVSLGLVPEEAPEALERLETWMASELGELDPKTLARCIRERYGDDQTFSVPILTTCALGGRLGEGAEAWRDVPALPFELAALPHAFFEWLRLPMVSYALPALIAIGQVRHHFRPGWNPVARMVRAAAREATLRKLERIQPTSGGFLEAAPLTSFVTMSLVAMGLDTHPVAVAGLRFLSEGVREDGAWPIDTNLDTWLTSLSIHALGGGLETKQESVRRFLVEQQYREVHPYTEAAPGGWAWTDLTGGVPDADDTSGALLALRRLAGATPDSDSRQRAAEGCTWLLGLQNRDGGIPTFCRGWGRLPFDRSSPDISAHAARALAAWLPELDDALAARVAKALARIRRYLVKAQREDGAWVPLWFGNQHEAEQENPLYGSSRVLLAFEQGADDPAFATACRRALAWLLDAQHDDGSFGGAAGLPASVEESALGLEALAAVQASRPDAALRERLLRGAAWLDAAFPVGSEARVAPSPIGLYFAKLWYSERLYPLIFGLAAVRGTREALEASESK